MLFSAAELSRWNSYRFYRLDGDRPAPYDGQKAPTYTAAFIEKVLLSTGFKFEMVGAPSALGPGALGCARKQDA